MKAQEKAQDKLEEITQRLVEDGEALAEYLNTIRNFKLEAKRTLQRDMPADIVVERYLEVNKLYDFRLMVSIANGSVTATVSPVHWQAVNHTMCKNVSVNKRPPYEVINYHDDGTMMRQFAILFFSDEIAAWLEEVADEVVAEVKEVVDVIRELAERARPVAVANRLAEG